MEKFMTRTIVCPGFEYQLMETSAMRAILVRATHPMQFLGGLLEPLVCPGFEYQHFETSEFCQSNKSKMTVSVFGVLKTSKTERLDFFLPLIFKYISFNWKDHSDIGNPNLEKDSNLINNSFNLHLSGIAYIYFKVWGSYKNYRNTFLYPFPGLLELFFPSRQEEIEAISWMWVSRLGLNANIVAPPDRAHLNEENQSKWHSSTWTRLWLE